MEFMKKLDVLPSLTRFFKGGFNPELDVKLKKTEMDTLLYIKFSEGNSMNYYSSKVNLENGSFTYLADKLESNGLIKRVYIDADKRKKGLVLTEEGHKVMDELVKQFEKHLSLKLERLNDQDKKNLLNAVAVLGDIKEKLES